MHRRIEDYALIGNTCTVALQDRNGAIGWLCLPRFDSASCFAAILGKPENGHWRIAPQQRAHSVRRRYIEGTLVLETRFETDEGIVELLDFMPLNRDDRFGDLVRIVRGVRGAVQMKCELVIRFHYGSVIPWVRRRRYGLSAVAGPDALALRTPIKLHGEDMRTVAEFTVRPGDAIPFTLTWYPSWKRVPKAEDPMRQLDETQRWWREWSKACTAPEQWREAVVRSAITLKALTYSPTGGIVAAPTTSLPEQPGGHRNWDYRYCWLRDATFTLYALMLTGYKEEARAWRKWLERAVAGSPSNLQIMYGLAGERQLDESELDWLSGFEASRPVRIGNAAYSQQQLDVFGEIMDAFHMARTHGLTSDGQAWSIQLELMRFLAQHWHGLGSGLWEGRGPKREYTYSRVMTWVAADRSVKAIERFGLHGPAEEFRHLRKSVHDEVCRNAFDQERNTFVQYRGGKALDAALLLIPLVGFLPADDPRVVGTIEAIQRELTVDGFVRRYQTDDGRDGFAEGEGAFLACSFWLVDNLALIGRKEEARGLFEKLLDIRNDVGLLAEEYDPRSRRQLGNFPQAYSHVGLINSAINLSSTKGAARHRSEH